MKGMDTASNVIRIISAAAILSLSSFFSTAQATVIVLPTLVDTGIFAGEMGTLTITYDETLLDAAGDGTFSPLTDPMLDYTLDMFGQIFDDTDDVDYPDFPELTISAFEVIDVNFVISELPDSINPIAIDLPGLIGFGMGLVTFDAAGAPIVIVDTDTAVPAPAPLALIGLGLLAFANVRRHRD